MEWKKFSYLEQLSGPKSLGAGLFHYDFNCSGDCKYISLPKGQNFIRKHGGIPKELLDNGDLVTNSSETLTYTLWVPPHIMAVNFKPNLYVDMDLPESEISNLKTEIQYKNLENFINTDKKIIENSKNLWQNFGSYIDSLYGTGPPFTNKNPRVRNDRFTAESKINESKWYYLNRDSTEINFEVKNGIYEAQKNKYVYDTIKKYKIIIKKNMYPLLNAIRSIRIPEIMLDSSVFIQSTEANTPPKNEAYAISKTKSAIITSDSGVMSDNDRKVQLDLVYSSLNSSNKPTHYHLPEIVGGPIWAFYAFQFNENWDGTIGTELNY